MSKVSSYFLNLILFFALVGGVAFCAPSIKGFASSTTSYVDLYRSYYNQYTAGSVLYNSDHKYGTLVNVAASPSSYNLGSSSSIVFSSVEVYLVTTEGSYLIATGSSSTYTGALRYVDTGNRYFAGYPCGSITIAHCSVPSGSSYSSSSGTGLALSLSVDDLTLTDPQQIDLTIIKSNTESIISMLQDIDISTLESLLSSILSKVTGIDTSVSSIDSELVDIEGAIGGTNSRLTDILFEIYKLKKAVCFDFADTIDGNYHLSSLYFSSLSYSDFNHEVLPIGSAAFDFVGNSSTNLRFTFRVPESCKILVLSSAIDSNFNIPSIVGIYDYDGNPITFTQSPRYGRNTVIGRYITIPDYYKFEFLSIQFSFSNSARVRFALYDYVVGANDILNYMKEQWAQSSSAISDLGDHSSGTGTMQGDVFETESSYFGDFESAVSGAGVTGFNWSVFTGMGIFSSIVSSFYNLMPSELALYITAVLIVGCIAVFISAVGRVVKKGGQDG